jgi:hypothetical protein
VISVGPSGEGVAWAQRRTTALIWLISEEVDAVWRSVSESSCRVAMVEEK